MYFVIKSDWVNWFLLTSKVAILSSFYKDIYKIIKLKFCKTTSFSILFKFATLWTTYFTFIYKIIKLKFCKTTSFSILLNLQHCWLLILLLFKKLSIWLKLPNYCSNIILPNILAGQEYQRKSSNDNRFVSFYFKGKKGEGV